ncbi:hypothetical protein [Desulfovibrio sp.]|uniref:hypothetical protein n=1 Tax=Desulfovibrio sp. TaxID=885 RepID=UPI003D0D72DB
MSGIPTEALIKEPSGNAQVFFLARRDLFLKQEWTLPSSTVSKKAKQNRQTEYISVSLKHVMGPKGRAASIRPRGAARNTLIRIGNGAGDMRRGNFTL